MEINEVIKSLRDGKRLKRTDWGYADHAYIEFEMWHELPTVSIVGEYSNAFCSKRLYTFTFVDLESKNWVVY